MTSEPQKLRVLYVVSLFPCWSETFIVREIDELLRRGVDVRIVSLKYSAEAWVQSDAQALLGRVVYPPGAWKQLLGVVRQWFAHPLLSVAELWGLTRGLWQHPQAWLKSLAVWVRTLALTDTVKQLAPHRLHAHWATYPSTAAMWLSGRTGIPFSFTAHAHDIFLEDHLLADKLQRAAFGVTISEFNRRYLAERISPRAMDVMRVVHCGVFPSKLAFRSEARVAGRILSVGRLDAIKGFEILIDACALLQQRGVVFDCRIIGEGPLQCVLEQRIRDLGLQHRVRLLGALPQEQVRDHLYTASVFVLASVVTALGDRDGIPVALMEAMACGAPVVSTQVSGIPELVEHGVEGWLAQPSDARDLARFIERQLVDRELAQTMALAARRKVELQFDVAVEAEKLHAALV